MKKERSYALDLKNITFDPKLLNKTIKKIPLVVTLPVVSALGINNLSNDKVELSEKAKFIRNLEQNHKSSYTKARINDGLDEIILKEYHNSQYGSNPAFWALNPKDGKVYYVKYADSKEEEKHIEAEVEASKLYNLAGIKTPNIQKCILGSGEVALLSEYVSGMEIVENPKKAHTAFAVDAWLANWDSTIGDNTVLVNGELIKIDNGGALEYRAQGRIKDSFGDVVTELITLIDGVNFSSQMAYSGISYKELIASFEKVCSISDKEIFTVVSDKARAQTLINRRNYMSRVLEKIKTTPYDGKDIVAYMKTVTSNIDAKPFNVFDLAQELSDQYKGLINVEQQTGPSTAELYKMFLNLIKSKEKAGVKISVEQLLKIIEVLSKKGLSVDGLKGFQATCRNEHDKKIFIGLHRIASRTPQKDGEKISSYLNRIIKAAQKRQKQLDDFRIENIKSRLEYFVVEEGGKIEISEETRLELLEAINQKMKCNYETLRRLPQNASFEKMQKRWKHMCLGSNDILPEHLQKIMIESLPSYNSSKKPKTKSDLCFFNEDLAIKDYVNDFKYEPVYRWVSLDGYIYNFIEKFPKNGQIYISDRVFSCSMNKIYAEEDYCDSNFDMNLKFIIHPRSEVSKARILGYNQEVLYNKGEQFRVLDKELVEYVDPITKQSLFRWEIHMQEV